MNFERRRGNILELFDKISQLPLLIISIVVAIYAGTSLDMNLVTPAIFIAISPFIKLIKYLFTYYTVTDSQLIIESGILNKKRTEIPLRSITAVDLTQNVIYQIFKTYKIKIDNGSQARGAVNDAEVEFALKEDLAFLFKKLVEKDAHSKSGEEIDTDGYLASEEDSLANERRASEDLISAPDQAQFAGHASNAEQTDLAHSTSSAAQTASADKMTAAQYASSTDSTASARQTKDFARPDRTSEKAMPTINSSPLDFIILGLLEQKMGYIIGLFPIISIIAYALAMIGMTPSEESVNNILETFFSSGPILILILIAVIVLVAGATVLAIVRSIITFFGFRLSADSDKIHIEFGLLTKKKFTLPKEKINGIALRQNMLMRFFGRYQMEIMVIGYGDKSDQQVRQQPILFPIANKRRIKEIVETLLPDFEGEYYSEEKAGLAGGTSPKAFIYFFVNPGFLVSTVMLIVSLFTIFLELPLYFNETIATNASWIFVPVAALIEIAAFISIYLQYKNTRILPTPKNITIVSGGYQRKVSVIKTSSVESITAISNKWKHRKGFASIKLGYVAPLVSSKIFVRNRALAEFKALENVLEM